MSHEVEIDVERLDSAFAAFEQPQAALPPGQQYIGVDETPKSEWLATCVFGFEWLNAYAPNWGVPQEKVHELAEKAAAMLDQWFPSGPGDPDKLPPWAQFLVTLGAVVVMYGFDFETMTMKPLSEPVDEDEQQDETDTQQPEATPGRFSTMGSVEDE